MEVELRLDLEGEVAPPLVLVEGREGRDAHVPVALVQGDVQPAPPKNGLLVLDDHFLGQEDVHLVVTQEHGLERVADVLLPHEPVDVGGGDGLHVPHGREDLGGRDALVPAVEDDRLADRVRPLLLGETVAKPLADVADRTRPECVVQILHEALGGLEPSLVARKVLEQEIGSDGHSLPQGGSTFRRGNFSA